MHLEWVREKSIRNLTIEKKTGKWYRAYCDSRIKASHLTCLLLLTKFAMPFRLNSSWLGPQCQCMGLCRQSMHRLFVNLHTLGTLPTANSNTDNQGSYAPPTTIRREPGRIHLKLSSHPSSLFYFYLNQAITSHCFIVRQKCREIVFGAGRIVIEVYLRFFVSIVRLCQK